LEVTTAFSDGNIVSSGAALLLAAVRSVGEASWKMQLWLNINILQQ